MIRLIRIGLEILIHALACAITPGRLARARIVSRFSRRVLNILGIDLTERIAPGALPPAGSLCARGALLVGNHLSFLDILIIAAQRPVLFTTSVEKREAFGFGFLARIAGCLFVERRNRSRLERDIGEIAQALREGFQVVLFPEGTTGDGSTILPFKRGLFRAAVEAGAPIQPFCLQYVGVGGRSIREKDRENLFFYGDFGVGTHLLRLFRLKRIAVRLSWLEPRKWEGTDDMAMEVERLRQAISAIFEPWVSPPVCDRSKDQECPTVGSNASPLPERFGESPSTRPISFRN